MSEYMTFTEHAEDIRYRHMRGGVYITFEEALQLAAEDITDGYDDPQDVAWAALTWRNREVVGYTAYGYGYTARTLLEAAHVRWGGIRGEKIIRKYTTRNPQQDTVRP